MFVSVVWTIFTMKRKITVQDAKCNKFVHVCLSTEHPQLLPVLGPPLSVTPSSWLNWGLCQGISRLSTEPSSGEGCYGKSANGPQYPNLVKLWGNLARPLFVVCAQKSTTLLHFIRWQMIVMLEMYMYLLCCASSDTNDKPIVHSR